MYQQQASSREATEQLQIKKIAVAEAYKMVETDKITAVITVATFLKVKLMLQEGKW